MSNKKRRNREKKSETISLGLSKSDAHEVIVAESTESSQSKSGLFAYVRKAPWWVFGLMLLATLGTLGAGLKYLEDSAKQQKYSNQQNTNLLTKINPFAANPLPSPTPQLSKEYIYAGSRVLAVEDAAASAAPPADLAVWRPSNGQWWVMGGQSTQQYTATIGANNDVPALGDYDGDGKTDFCVYKDTTWKIIRSSDNYYYTLGFGTTNDKNAQADFDGDGKTDIAVYRPSTGTWFINHSSTSLTSTAQFGATGDVPVPADYDGDGRADVAVFAPTTGIWYIQYSSNSLTVTPQFGTNGDEPVSGDYDGDGKADIAVWRKNSATWYYLKSSDSQMVGYQYGIGTDKPVQNDYDGDGKVDMAQWRAVDSGAGDVGRWFILQSSNLQIRQEQWGITGDFPVPAFYRR